MRLFPNGRGHDPCSRQTSGGVCPRPDQFGGSLVSGGASLPRAEHNCCRRCDSGSLRPDSSYNPAWRFANAAWSINTAIPFEADNQSGVLQPSSPLLWKEGKRVSVIVSSVDSPILKAYGMMGRTDDAETLERIALDPEYLPEESS